MAVNNELRNNLRSFRDTFKDYTDCYTVIGGTACFILMEDAGFNFRATRDIDMILVLEDKRKSFGKVFWDYIVSGGYQCEQREGKTHYYRFIYPKPGFPEQIELFSRRDDFKVDQRIIPVSIDEDVSSLSAIALDDDFYHFMMGGRKTVDGISILDAEYLIPFKMYAWLNNKRDRELGLREVNTKDIEKHKKDVFRLLTLVNPAARIKTSGSVSNAVRNFLTEIANHPFEPKDIGINMAKTDACEIMKRIYL